MKFFDFLCDKYKTKMINSTFPSFSLQAAESFALNYFGVQGKATNLVSYADQNFYLRAENQSEYVLKIMNSNTSKRMLENHNALMSFLHGQMEDFVTPKVFLNIEGTMITEVLDENGNLFYLRLLSWVKGKIWVDIKPNSMELYEQLGQKLGKMSKLLQNFTPPFTPAPHSGYHWETCTANWLEETLVHIEAKENRQIAKLFLKDYAEKVTPNISKFRNGFVHNDANNFNILTNDTNNKQEVIGLIDFGLAMPSKVVCELAVACAYLCMKQPNPLKIVAALVKGFHAVFPLNEAEQKAIIPLMTRRILISVTHSALNRNNKITDDYVYYWEKSGWELLKNFSFGSATTALTKSACLICVSAPFSAFYLLISAAFFNSHIRC
jgi:Ser/Thr protein kinase RdoA (MazF antagonist)